MLSANTDAAINVECFMEDLDLYYMLTRDEFDKLI